MDDSLGILRQMLGREEKNAALAEAMGDNMAAHHRNACRALQAGIRALAQLDDGWRDITTIPRTGELVELLSANGKTDRGNWYALITPGVDVQDHLNTDNGEGNYTHWRPLRPLPSPPAQAQETMT